jgi:nitrite reductase (NO-forming)
MPRTAANREPKLDIMAAHPLSRRNWYLITNGVIFCWIIASIVGATMNASPILWAGTSSLWLLVHVPLLGALTSAVLVWSQHFADTLLRRPSPWGRPGLVARLALHSGGSLAVIFGVLGGVPTVTATGIGAVALAAALHGTLLARQRHGALVGRFAPLVRYYVASAILFILGIAAGGTLALGLAPELAGRLLLAHVILNVFGWLSVTALGTLVLLWPTVLHAKIPEGAQRRAGHALWLFVSGILLAAAAAIAGVFPLIALGIALWITGFALIFRDGWREARAVPPSTFAAWSLAAAAGWLLLSAVAVGVVGLTSSDALAARTAILDLLPPIVLGFAGQLLIGALSHLLPVLIIGSPSGARAAAQMLNRSAAFRVIALNVALAGLIALTWVGENDAPLALGAVPGLQGMPGLQGLPWLQGLQIARLALMALILALLVGFVVLVLLGAWSGRRARAAELTRGGALGLPGA